MTEPSVNSDSDFVINTILSSVKTAGGDAVQPRPTEEVIAKLVNFYEERLNRQKEEMKDEFIRILASKEKKPDRSDSQVQYDQVETLVESEESSGERKERPSATSSSETAEVSEELTSEDIATAVKAGDDEVIEVDIRPASARLQNKIPTGIPILHLGDFISPQKNNTQPDLNESSSAKGGEEQRPPLDVNAQMMMMMMNVLGGGSPNNEVIFSQEAVQDEATKPPEQERDEEATPQPTFDVNTQNEGTKENQRKEEISKQKEQGMEELELELVGNESQPRPNTGTSFYTDYDPANPLYLKPPSPKNEHQNNTKQTEGRSSRGRFGDSGDYLSPSASSASVRVQMYEKHQKQISDLKAYYEEELDDLRAKVHHLEQRQGGGFIPPIASFTSKYTNTSPSPTKRFTQSNSISSSNGISEFERECASLRLKVEWLDQAYKNATQRLKDAENQVDELATKLSAYTLRVADAGGEIEELRQECRQKDEEIDRLMTRNNSLMVEVDDAGRMLQIKDQSLAESDGMLNRLMREYQSLSKDYEALKVKHEGCDNALQDSKQEIANSKRQLNKLMFEFKRLEHDNGLLTKRLQLTTSFNVAERYASPPPVSTSRSSYQIHQAPLSAREVRDRRSDIAAAGLPSSEAHATERKFANNSKVSFGTAPYACEEESSDSTDKDSTNHINTTPQKVAIFKDQGVQAATASSRPFSRDEESVLLRAERELFASKQSKQPGSNKSSPRKMTVSVSTDFVPPIASSSKPSSNKQPLSGPSSTEQQFDRLLIEKQRIEASLNRLPAAPHNQTIRANKELLERQLEEIERRLASLRFALKKSQVIRSSFN